MASTKRFKTHSVWKQEIINTKTIMLITVVSRSGNPLVSAFKVVFGLATLVIALRDVAHI